MGVRPHCTDILCCGRLSDQLSKGARASRYYDRHIADRHRADRLVEAEAELEKQIQEVEAEKLAYDKAQRRLDRSLAASVRDAETNFYSVVWEAECAVADDLAAALVVNLVNTTAAWAAVAAVEAQAEAEWKVQLLAADERHGVAVEAVTDRQSLEVTVINRRLNHALSFEAAEKLKLELVEVTSSSCLWALRATINLLLALLGGLLIFGVDLLPQVDRQAAQELGFAAGARRSSNNNAAAQRAVTCAAARQEAKFSAMQAHEGWLERERPLQAVVDAAAAAGKKTAYAMVGVAEVRTAELDQDGKWEQRMVAAEDRYPPAVAEAEARWVADHMAATENKQTRFETAAVALLSAVAAANTLATEQANAADDAAVAIAATLEADLPGIRQRARTAALERSTVLELAGWTAGSLPFERHSVDKLLLPNSLYFLPSLDLGIREIRRVLRPAGRLVCLTKLKAVTDGVAAGALSPELLCGESELVACVMEAGFGKPEISRFRLKLNHQAEQASCAAAAAKEMAGWRERRRPRLKKRGAKFLAGWEAVRWVEEISTALHQCSGCGEHSPPSTELTWRPVFFGRPTRVMLGQPKLGGGLVLCPLCHELLVALAAEESALARRHAQPGLVPFCYPPTPRMAQQKKNSGPPSP